MSDENNKPRIKNAMDNKKSGNYYSSNGNLEFSYNTEKLKEENKYKLQGEAFPKTINCFNWGACIFPYIWGPFNNSPIAVLSLVLCFIPYIGWLLSIVFSIYCGVKGNEWAWENKEWKSLNEFHATQRKWAAWSIGIEMAVIIGISTFIFLAIQIIGNYGSGDQLYQLQSMLGI